MLKDPACNLWYLAVVLVMQHPSENKDIFATWLFQPKLYKFCHILYNIHKYTKKNQSCLVCFSFCAIFFSFPPNNVLSCSMKNLGSILLELLIQNKNLFSEECLTICNYVNRVTSKGLLYPEKKQRKN